MSKLALFSFVAKPGEILRGVRRLGGKGAVLHGLRRAGAAMEHAYLGPCQLRINPMGTVCNHSCPMCWLSQLDPADLKQQQRTDRELGLTLEQYVAILDNMPPGLTEVNVVGGGEPLVHPDCVKIMAEIKRRKLSGYLITNGSLMREPVARAMLEMGWDLTRVSTHAGDPTTYCQIHGVDHFELVRSNLINFDRIRREIGRAEQCQLHTHFVLQRENIETIPKMFALAEEVHADHMVFEIVFAFAPETLLTAPELARTEALLGECSRASRVSSNAVEIVDLLRREQRECASRPLVPSVSAVSEAAERPDGTAPLPPASPATEAPSAEAPSAEASDAPQPPSKPDVYRPANRCSVGFDSSFITALGDVLPCCFSSEKMGNVKEQSYREIWRGKQYNSFRKRLINGRFPEYCSRFRCKLTSFLHD